MVGKSALLIIDVQNDFCEGGSLPVPGGKSVVAPINELMSKSPWDLIVASKDWHPQNHVSFASNHPDKKPFEDYTLKSEDGKREFTSKLWPDHCIANTNGADIVEGLDMSRIGKIINKGESPKFEYYSAFQDVFQQNKSDLLDLLESNGISNVVIVGLALDFCVQHTAIDSAKFGFNTSVILDCTRAITEEGGATARRQLESAGVNLL